MDDIGCFGKSGAVVAFPLGALLGLLSVEDLNLLCTTSLPEVSPEGTLRSPMKSVFVVGSCCTWSFAAGSLVTFAEFFVGSVEVVSETFITCSKVVLKLLSCVDVVADSALLGICFKLEVFSFVALVVLRSADDITFAAVVLLPILSELPLSMSGASLLVDEGWT